MLVGCCGVECWCVNCDGGDGCDWCLVVGFPVPGGGGGGLTVMEVVVVIGGRWWI